MIIEINGSVFDTKDILLIGSVKRDNTNPDKETYMLEISFKYGNEKLTYYSDYNRINMKPIETLQLIKDKIVKFWKEDNY